MRIVFLRTWTILKRKKQLRLSNGLQVKKKQPVCEDKRESRIIHHFFFLWYRTRRWYHTSSLKQTGYGFRKKI